MEQIFAAVKRVIDFSNDMDCKVGKLAEGWKEGKSGLIKDFGGRLIIESPTPFTVDKPDDDKILEYRQYVDDICYETANEELRAFLIEQGWTAFYNNLTREKWEMFGIKVPKGMKITKALKFFLKKKEDVDHWQIVYSRLMQNLKITGTLCISVHPLDYLSMSETTHKWRSCHSLDGEYRSGNLSYMQDNCTVVAYLRSEGEYELPGFPVDTYWNSKKWRALFYVNEDRDLIIGSKPYPFDNELLVNASFKLLQENIGGDTWEENYLPVRRELIHDVLSDNLGAVQFNDCLCSASFEPKVKCKYGNLNYEDCKPIEVGSPTWCLECEDEIIEFGADYSCVNCGDYLTCEECGCHVYADEAYVLDKQCLCPSCYDDAVIWCDGCGGAHSRENPEMVYDSQEDTWHCPECYDELLSERAQNWSHNEDEDEE